MNTQSYFVTVNEAIHAGRINLKYIPAGLLIVSSVLYGVLFLNNIFLPATLGNGGDNARQMFSLFLIPIVGLVIGFVWRSVHSASWKIWALENVQDVHRLYQVATNNGMIYKRDSWLNQLEFKTSDQRQRLVELEDRLDAPREMEEAAPPDFDSEQSFGYSWKMALLPLAIFIPFIAFFYYKIGKMEFFPFGFFVLFFVAIQLFRWVPRIGKPDPIRFDDASLTILNNTPLDWRDITNIVVEQRRHGKSSKTVLMVESKSEPRYLELDINDLVGSSSKIEQTLYNYWVRGKKRR